MKADFSQETGGGGDQNPTYGCADGDYPAALSGSLPPFALIATAVAFLGTGIVLGTIFGVFIGFGH